LQPIGAKGFDRVVHRRIVVLGQLLFGDRIPIRARASLALQMGASGSQDEECDNRTSGKTTRHIGIMPLILW
jgi:hypothetical protein